MKKEQEQRNNIIGSLLDMLIEMAPSEDLKEKGLLTKEIKAYNFYNSFVFNR